MELSPKSINQAKKLIQDFADSYKKGIKNAIKTATKELYERVIQNCEAGNLSAYTDAIHWDYDKSNNVGRVWVTSEGRGSHGLVIILNEFGTGIKGDAKQYAKKHGYKINRSKKGKTGWAFPTKYGTMSWTHGVRSKKMFYDAYESIKKDFIGIVNVQLLGEVGNLYEEVRK